MKTEKLYKLIDSLAGDIDFTYKGKHGSICPFSRTDIALAYDSNVHSHTSISDVLNDKMFDGKCLNEISERIILL